MKLLSRYPMIFYIIIFPGVVIHEAAHYLACLITLTKVKRVQFFSKTGGFVEHYEPKLVSVGTLVISAAPFIVGFLLVYLLAGALLGDSNILLKILYGYLMSSVVLSMFPSREDVHNAFVQYVLVIAGILIFSYKIPAAYLDPIITTSLYLAGALLVTCIPLYLIGRKRWK